MQDPSAPRTSWRALSLMPAWLVSLVVHLAAMLLMALLVVNIEQPLPGTIFEAVPTDMEEVTLLEPNQVQIIELQTPDVMAASVASSEITSASLADAVQLGAVAAISADSVDLSASSEVGELFTGDGGRAMGSSMPGNVAYGAQFFGVKATGRRFVFIVDSSNSMKGGKFDAAKEELMYAIRRLSKEQAFYVIFFDQNAERMLLLPDKEPALLPVPAINTNINACEKWVHTVEYELRTDPYDAVKFAIEMVPDAIYLLTDGKFTDRGKTERYLKEQNLIDDPIEGQRPKVVVHTICFWKKDGEETLQAIAKAYGGTYRFVPEEKKAAPPKKKDKKKK